MGSRMQQEREKADPHLNPGCRSLGQYESHWDTSETKERSGIPPKGAKASKEHKQRGGQSNHGLKVDPGQDLNEIPLHHPRRRRSYSAS